MSARGWPASWACTRSPLEDAAKPVYHAASAFASNYLVTLTAVAVALLERAGVERDHALEALRPLQQRTLEVAGLPPTGPIARGDAATIAAHLEAIGPEPATALPGARPGHPAAGRAGGGAGGAEPSVTVGLVPTMGALHDGHRALLRRPGPSATG